MNRSRRMLISGATSVATLALLGQTRAQGTWPNKPIRIVVGFPAGGLTDSLARGYGEFLGQKLGQPVVVENRPGVAGMLAGAEVAKSAPDGHTLWMTLTGAMNQNKVLYKKMPYDPDKDFAYVAGFDSGPLPLAVPLTSPLKSFRDFVELSRKQRITLGNYATGSYTHMLATHMNTRMGAKIDPVPYKGEIPMWLDVAAGEITAGLGSVLAALPHIQSGRLRAIAVSSRTRSPLLPDVKTFEEEGFSDPVFTLVSWVGLFAPAGTPNEIVQRVSNLVQEGANSPRIQQLGKSFGMSTRPWTAQEFERIDRDNKPHWLGLAKDLNVTMD